MLNRFARHVNADCYDIHQSLVATYCFINITSAGVTIKAKRTSRPDKDKFLRWDQIKLFQVEFSTT